MALLAYARAQGKKMSWVKKVVIGGSACPPSMIEAWEKEHGARVIHAWGMTEMSPVGTTGVLLPKHEALGEYVTNQMLYYPTVTREDFAHKGRITTVMDNGQLTRDLALLALASYRGKNEEDIDLTTPDEETTDLEGTEE